MQTLELAILDWIQGAFRCGLLDAVLPAVTSWSNHGEIWIVLAALLLLFHKTRWIGISVALGLLIDLISCNLILKPLIARIRPCDVNTAVELLIARPHDFSFPSGHTAVSFAAVGALFASKSRLWIPACILAAVIAFSRLYLYVHWPTDILGGVVVGLASGCLGNWIRVKLQVRFVRRNA